MTGLPLPLSTGILMVLSYMTGSIPFAVIAGLLVKKKDIRNEGSGNAGTTNVFRILGWRAALPVLAADFFKGFLPVFYAPVLMERLSPGIEFSGGLEEIISVLILSAVVTGHAFPLWAGFRGGKGVACSAGGITALFPAAAPVCLAVFLLVLKISATVSIASLAAAWSLPLTCGILTMAGMVSFSPVLFLFFIIIAMAITLLHRKNIRRIIRGEEPKTFRKPS